MKLKASATADRSGVSSLPSQKVRQWLRKTLLHASCLSQSAVAAGAYGIDFFDPSAVRAANREVLRGAVETPEAVTPSGNLLCELADPFTAPV